MRYMEWLVLFVISGLGIALANFVGFDVGFMDSLPGILVLLAIAAAGVAVGKVVPLRLPVVAYVSIIGLLAACPSLRAESLSSRLQGRSILQLR